MVETCIQPSYPVATSYQEGQVKPIISNSAIGIICLMWTVCEDQTGNGVVHNLPNAEHNDFTPPNMAVGK
jgi:hypothetical protein